MAMSDRAKAARNAYLRQWRSKNRDKVRMYEERRWERIAQKLAAESKTNQMEGTLNDGKEE